MTTDQPEHPDGAPAPADPPVESPADMSDADIPIGQRLFDSPFLLLFACMLVMFVFFTGWGLLEIMSLEPATLP